MLFWKRTADDVAWTAHIAGIDHSAATVRVELEAAPDESRHRIKFADVVGQFVKMRTGKNGQRTPGFRPIGDTKDWWQRTKHEAAGKLIPFEYLGRLD